MPVRTMTLICAAAQLGNCLSAVKLIRLDKDSLVSDLWFNYIKKQSRFLIRLFKYGCIHFLIKPDWTFLAHSNKNYSNHFKQN